MIRILLAVLILTVLCGQAWAQGNAYSREICNTHADCKKCYEAIIAQYNNTTTDNHAKPAFVIDNQILIDNDGTSQQRGYNGNHYWWFWGRLNGTENVDIDCIFDKDQKIVGIGRHK